MSGIGTTTNEDVNHFIAAEVCRAVGDPPSLLWFLMPVVAVAAYDVLKCTVIQWWKRHRHQQENKKTEASVVDNDAVGILNPDSVGVETNDGKEDVFFPCTGTDFDEGTLSQPQQQAPVEASGAAVSTSRTPAAGSGASLPRSNITSHVADTGNVAAAHDLGRCTRSNVTPTQSAASPSVSVAATRSPRKRKSAATSATPGASSQSNGSAFKRQRVAASSAKPKPVTAAITPRSSQRACNSAQTGQAVKHAAAAVAVKRTLQQAAAPVPTKKQRMDDEWWHQKYALLKAYHRKHKHCLVPTFYPGLGWWVSKQRLLFSGNKVAQERKMLLDKIGFIWDVHEVQWEGHYQDLVQYKEQYGDCLVPRAYTSAGNLGIWVDTQRTSFKREELSMDRIQRLDAIGFVWAVRKAT